MNQHQSQIATPFGIRVDRSLARPPVINPLRERRAGLRVCRRVSLETGSALGFEAAVAMRRSLGLGNAGRLRMTGWINALKDQTTRARIQLRVDRLVHGSPGLHRHLSEGVSERKIDIGPGYRAHDTERNAKPIVLLAGDDKSIQVTKRHRHGAAPCPAPIGKHHGPNHRPQDANQDHRLRHGRATAHALRNDGLT
jgi:putative addiction module killer protein